MKNPRTPTNSDPTTPWQTISQWFWLNSATGVSTGKPRDPATASNCSSSSACSGTVHGANAPSRIVLPRSGKTSSGLIARTVPVPSHSGHAPNGLSKLNNRTSGGGYSNSQRSQFQLALKRTSLQGSPETVDNSLSFKLSMARPPSTNNAQRSFPFSKAVSSESSNRASSIDRVEKRSTTTHRC